MKSFDRVVLYGGVGLFAIMGFMAYSTLGEINKKIRSRWAAGAGPIQVTIPPATTNCMVNAGAYEVGPNAAGIAIQWQTQTGNTYYVTFQKNQDPFGTGPDTIQVGPGKTPTTAKTISAQADSDCTLYQECVYPYTLSIDSAGAKSCLAGTGTASTLGIVIKPSQ